MSMMQIFSSIPVERRIDGLLLSQSTLYYYKICLKTDTFLFELTWTFEKKIYIQTLMIYRHIVLYKGNEYDM